MAVQMAWVARWGKYFVFLYLMSVGGRGGEFNFIFMEEEKKLVIVVRENLFSLPGMRFICMLYLECECVVCMFRCVVCTPKVNTMDFFQNNIFQKKKKKRTRIFWDERTHLKKQ